MIKTIIVFEGRLQSQFSKFTFIYQWLWKLLIVGLGCEMCQCVCSQCQKQQGYAFILAEVIKLIYRTDKSPAQVWYVKQSVGAGSFNEREGRPTGPVS